ncbi:MAG: hypothetical protein LBG78_06010 [Azoarcus sp.]|nr:hypothetical protein [Azoarcus sp.]
MISDSSSSVANTIQNASAYTSRWHSGASGEAKEQPAFTLDARGNAASPTKDESSGETRRTSELSTADLRRVEEMKATDRAVRAHEAAHMAAGGNLVTSGASYTYETGPDGQRYAVGGEVGIDTSKGRTPEETLARAEQIRAAALAPADPSGQDRAVAAAAAKMAADARAEIARANLEKGTGTSSSRQDENRAQSFGQAIERGISPNGQSVDIYA